MPFKIHFLTVWNWTMTLVLSVGKKKTLGMIYGLQNLGPIITDLRHQTRLHMAHWSHFDWMCFFAVSDLKKELLHTLQFKEKFNYLLLHKRICIFHLSIKIFQINFFQSNFQDVEKAKFLKLDLKQENKGTDRKPMWVRRLFRCV